MKAIVRGLATKALLEARLIRIVGKAVISNLHEEVLSPRAAAAGLLRPRTVDIAAAGDGSTLRMSDFTDVDFDVARRIIANKSNDYTPST